MKSHWIKVSLFACGFAQFLAAPSYSEDCDAILTGIYTNLKYKSATEFQLDFKRVLNYSEEQREEARKQAEASGNIGLLKILTLGFGGGQESEEVKELKKKIQLNEDLAWHSAEYDAFMVKFASPDVVGAWKECKLKNFRGVQASLSGDPSRTFIVNITYMPTEENSPKELIITNADVVGMEPVGKNGLNGSVLRNYTGISQVFKRTGKQAASITVNFKNYPGVTKELAKINKDPLPTPKKIIAAKAIIGTTRNKERDGHVFLNLISPSGTLIVEQGELGKGEVFDEDRPPVEKPLTVKNKEVLQKGEYKIQVRLDGKNIHWDGNVKIVITLDDSTEKTIGSGSFEFRDNVVENHDGRRIERTLNQRIVEGTAEWAN